MRFQEINLGSREKLIEYLRKNQYTEANIKDQVSQ